MFSCFIRIKLLFVFLLMVACSSSLNKIDSIQNEFLGETIVITCPDVKFIENLDRVNIKRQNKNIYSIKFYEVKWKCYSDASKINIDNIDLFVSFKVDYFEDEKDFQLENFSFIVALLNENREIVTKEKFNRNFISESKTSIIKNSEGLINIKIKNSRDQIYNHELLLGFYKNMED